MGNNEEQTPFEWTQQKFYVLMFLAVIGGNSGSLMQAVKPETRADPFTGTDGVRMEERIDDRVDLLNKHFDNRFDILENRLDRYNHRIELLERSAREAAKGKDHTHE